MLPASTRLALAAEPVSAQLAGKRLLVVEEVVKGSLGHWYGYVRAVVAMNRAEGVDARAVTHAKIDPALAREIGAIPAFDRSNWDGVYDGPGRWRSLAGMVRHNWLVYRTMSRILREHGPVDCLFVPTVWLHHVWGWRLLMAVHGRSIGRLVLLFWMVPGTHLPITKPPVFARSMAIIGWAIRSFSRQIKRGKVVFATDNSRLTSLYQSLCGTEPVVFPSPLIAPMARQARPGKKPGDAIIFSSLGPPRFEKGIDLLQAAIKACLAQGFSRPVKFVIQWNTAIRDPAGNTYAPDRELLTDPRVEFLNQSLSSADYAAATGATDCMLLPYRHAAYTMRSSGVAIEAATAGIPMVYTRDTWNADLVESCGSGVAIDDGDVAGLVCAIQQIVDHYQDYRDQAAARSVVARQVHSPAAFMARLWGIGSAHG